MGFRCGACGQEHDGLPMDVGFNRPADYFAVPKAQRERRCDCTSDWCVIDGRRYYIRGCLSVPVVDADDDFVWGLWARVSARSFRRYRELYDADGSGEPPFRGYLSGEHSGYKGLDGHAVAVQLGGKKDRPAFTLRRSKHLLYVEQQRGITLHRVHEILRTMFPNQFAS
jgi:hypothetical protein